MVHAVKKVRKVRQIHPRKVFSMLSDISQRLGNVANTYGNGDFVAAGLAATEIIRDLRGVRKTCETLEMRLRGGISVHDPGKYPEGYDLSVLPVRFEKGKN